VRAEPNGRRGVAERGGVEGKENPGVRDRHWRLRNLLARPPLFAGLSTRQLNRLAALGRILDFAAHGFLFRAGETIHGVYVLGAGSAKPPPMLPPETNRMKLLPKSRGRR